MGSTAHHVSWSRDDVTTARPAFDPIDGTALGVKESASNLGDREKYRQRRRRPRAPRDEAADNISQEVAEAYELVPEIGEGLRWYDYPYRGLEWLSRGWRRKVIPDPLLTRFNHAINYLIPFNEHDRNKARSLDGWLHNVHVPKDEHVNVPGIWVLELFPPTELSALERSLARNGWDRSRWHSPVDDANQAILEKSRSGHGYIRWRLVDVVGKGSTYWIPDGIRAELPADFDYVGLEAFQVGESLTAVIAHFHLTDAAAVKLDATWHEPHEPLLLRAKPRWRALDRQWAAHWRTQTARRAQHDLARAWLAERLPGFFAHRRSPQPLLDLMLLDKFDPTVAPPAKRSREAGNIHSAAYRALGLSAYEFYQATSSSLPKLVLSGADPRMHEALGDSPTWTLWGRRDAVVKAVGNRLSNSGKDMNRAIASGLVEEMYNVFVMLGASEYIRAAEDGYAKLRDRASVRHGKFHPRALAELRRSLLDLSLNLSSVSSDLRASWDRKWVWEGDARFIYRKSAMYRSRDKKAGIDESKPINYNDNLRDQQLAALARLESADRDYRSILSTAASLGASADSYKLGRIALWVAISSLAVALVTLLFSELSGHSVLGLIWNVIVGDGGSASSVGKGRG